MYVLGLFIFSSIKFTIFNHFTLFRLLFSAVPRVPTWSSMFIVWCWQLFRAHIVGQHLDFWKLMLLPVPVLNLVILCCLTLWCAVSHPQPSLASSVHLVGRVFLEFVGAWALHVLKNWDERRPSPYHVISCCCELSVGNVLLRIYAVYSNHVVGGSLWAHIWGPEHTTRLTCVWIII